MVNHIAFRVNHGQAVTDLDIVVNQVEQESTLTRARGANHVKMSSSVIIREENILFLASMHVYSQEGILGLGHQLRRNPTSHLSGLNPGG